MKKKKVYELTTRSGNKVMLDISMIIVDENNMIKINDICSLAGKETYHWTDNKRTKSLIVQYQELNPDHGIPCTVIQGGDPDKQGTWIHKDLAHSFMMWCFPSYELIVNDILNELFSKGTVTVVAKTKAEMYLEMAKIEQEKEQLEKEKEQQQRSITHGYGGHLGRHRKRTDTIKNILNVKCDKDIIPALSKVSYNEMKQITGGDYDIATLKDYVVQNRVECSLAPKTDWVDIKFPRSVWLAVYNIDPCDLINK
jgi:hypothetical protein